MFDCEGSRLAGIAHVPEQPSSRGLVIVVGGPQYRVGSHRQFVLLARYLAKKGYCTLRFDCRGMGDSEGEHPGFEHLEPDIRAAIDTLFQLVPTLTDVVLWGLCDAASAALFYAHNDPRVSGAVLLNPWVHDPRSENAPYLRDYYMRRLGSWELWKQLLTGKMRVLARVSAIKTVWSSRRQRQREATATPQSELATSQAPMSYQRRMCDGARRFGGHVLVVLSGEDLVALEFKSLTSRDGGWKKLLRSDRWSVRELAGATHTFSRQEWRDQVAEWTSDWLAVW